MRYNEEEVEYLLKQEKTEYIVEELLVLNFGLVRKQLNKFYLHNNPDALSLAYEALYNAIITYDKTKSCKFSTYATVCIYNKLGSYIRSLNTQNTLDVISYDTPISEDGLVMFDKLASGATADSELLSECGVSIIMQKIKESVNELKNPLHKRIVEMWVGSEFVMQHERIAAALGCTQSYVSQVVKTFKNTLKKKLEENK